MIDTRTPASSARSAAAFADRDLATMPAAMTDDIPGPTPGRDLLAGDPDGCDAVLAQLGCGAGLSGGTYRIEVLDVLAGDDHAAVVLRGRGEREGRALDLVHVGL